MTTTTNNIKERIDYLETQIFYLAMKDHWDHKDFELDRKMNFELLKLKKQLGMD